MAPEVSVGFQNSGKRFEKLTLNIRSSSARPPGCGGPGLEPQPAHCALWAAQAEQRL